MDVDLREVCEGPLTSKECQEVLSQMPSGKSPGNDGLTKEFYAKFWDVVSIPLISALNYSYGKSQSMSFLVAVEVSQSVFTYSWETTTYVLSVIDTGFNTSSVIK